MLAIAGPGREASEKSDLWFTEAAALPFAGCQCLCLPAGPTKHQVLSWLSNALSNGPCTSSSQILQPLHVHQAIKTAPKPVLPSMTFWVSTVSPRTRLGLIRLGRTHAGKTPTRRLLRQTRVHYLRSASEKSGYALRNVMHVCGWLASCCCFLLPAASCFLLPAASCFLTLAASMTGHHLEKDVHALSCRKPYPFVACWQTHRSQLDAAYSIRITTASWVLICQWLLSGRGP
jgi:hypothetical protein